MMQPRFEWRRRWRISLPRPVQAYLQIVLAATGLIENPKHGVAEIALDFQHERDGPNQNGGAESPHRLDHLPAGIDDETGATPEGVAWAAHMSPPRTADPGSPKGGVAPVRLGDFRAGVTGLAMQAQTEEKTEDKRKRHCEFPKGLFVI